MAFKGKFIDPKQIEEVISFVKALAETQGIAIALAGGVALQMYGSPRMTSDVDFVVSQEPETESLRKIRRLGFGGHRYQAPNGAMVDLIARSDEYQKLYEEALKNAVESEDGPWVVTPKYLAAMKLAAGRPKDILDLKWLIQDPDLLDLKETQALVYRYFGRYGQDRFIEIVDQAKLEREQERRAEGEE